MARRRTHAPLRVYLNNRLVGHLAREAGGATSFRYDESWLEWNSAISVSLSLPLREDAYRGAIDEIAAAAEGALDGVHRGLPRNFPGIIHASVSAAMLARLPELSALG